MSKHIIDSTRFRNGSNKSLQYARIETAERRHPHSKALQKQLHQADPNARARRFLEIDRRKSL
ncbi:unnamed protein product [Ectocarpus sp. 12 AP-2014]